MIQSIRQFISNQSNQIFGNRRIPLHFAYGVFGGLSVLFANCQAAFAATKDIQSFSYKARATGPKRPQGQGDIIVQLDGNASLYLKRELQN